MSLARKPVEVTPRLRLPTLSPEWQTVADTIHAAQKQVNLLCKDVYWIFQPDPYKDLHVGLGWLSYNGGPRWSISTMALPVPPEDRVYIPDDQDGMWDYSHRLMTLEAAQATAALLRYVYADPSEMAPYEREGALPEDVSDKLLASLTGANAGARGRGARPNPRLIRTPHDAELLAADWMRWMGYTNVGVTPIGADAGIDVFSNEAIAQVKMEGIPTGRPVIQNAYGVAAAEGKNALVFSLGGYIRTAIDWADKVGVPLFRFDLQGTPEGVNLAARRLLGE